jgi:serine/threonine protein phosphatase PrpC
MEDLKVEHVQATGIRNKKRRLEDGSNSSSADEGSLNLTYVANVSILKGRNKETCEDNCIATLDLGSTISDCCNGIAFCAVIDGHGGSMAVDWIHQNMELLFSKCITRNLMNWGLSSLDSVEDERAKCIIVSSMCSAFAHAENIVCKKEDESGVCLLVCIIFRNFIMCFNSGDCGAVLQRASGESEELNILHGVDCPGEYDWITSLGTQFVNGRVGGSLEPTRSLGDIDVKSLLPGVVSHTPDVHITTLSSLQVQSTAESKGETTSTPYRSDMIVMCTDGVHGPFGGMDKVVEVAREWEFLAFTNVDASLGSTAKKLTSTAVGERMRGTDDASAVVVFIKRAGSSITDSATSGQESGSDGTSLPHK